MKGWFECSKCKHQWEAVGQKFTSRCPQCGCDRASRGEVGGKQPDWYRVRAEQAKPKSLLGRMLAALERKP